MPQKTLPHPAAQLTASQVETLLAEYADLHWTRQQVEADLDAERRALDAHLLPIKEHYRPRMEQLAKVIEDLHASADERAKTLRQWALAHAGDFSGARRSLDLLHGVIGFRLGKPRLVELPRRTFARAAFLIAKLSWGKKYLLPAPPNKAALLKDRASFLGKDPLKNLGLAIVQDDNFFIEPKQVRSDLLQPAERKEAA